MPSERKKKPLFVAKSVGELNDHAEKLKTKISIRSQVECKRYCDAITDVFRKAEAKLIDGDEENAYILFMRFLHVFSIIRKSYEYTKRKKYYDEILVGTPIKAIQTAEELATSLSKRYSELKEDLEVPLPAKTLPDLKSDPPLTTKRNDAVSKRSKSEQAPTVNKNGNIPSGSQEEEISNVLPSVPDVGDFFETPTSKPIPLKKTSLSVMDLYSMLKSSKNSSLLLLDVRPSNEYNQSKIKRDFCINIPPELLKPGATVNSIERRLAKDVWEIWVQRNERDVIVILDADSDMKQITPSHPAQILKDAIFLWESGTSLKSEPLIIDGGFQAWILHYPSLTTNPYYKKPTQATVFNTSSTLPAFSYPEIPNYEEKSQPENKSEDASHEPGRTTELRNEPGTESVNESGPEFPPAKSDGLSQSHVNMKLEEVRRILEERDKERQLAAKVSLNSSLGERPEFVPQVPSNSLQNVPTNGSQKSHQNEAHFYKNEARSYENEARGNVPAVYRNTKPVTSEADHSITAASSMGVAPTFADEKQHPRADPTSSASYPPGSITESTKLPSQHDGPAFQPGIGDSRSHLPGNEQFGKQEEHFSPRPDGKGHLPFNPPSDLSSSLSPGAYTRMQPPGSQPSSNFPSVSSAPPQGTMAVGHFQQPQGRQAPMTTNVPMTTPHSDRHSAYPPQPPHSAASPKDTFAGGTTLSTPASTLPQPGAQGAQISPVPPSRLLPTAGPPHPYPNHTPPNTPKPIQQQPPGPYPKPPANQLPPNSQPAPLLRHQPSSTPQPTQSAPNTAVPIQHVPATVGSNQIPPDVSRTRESNAPRPPAISGTTPLPGSIPAAPALSSGIPNAGVLQGRYPGTGVLQGSVTGDGVAAGSFAGSVVPPASVGAAQVLPGSTVGGNLHPGSSVRDGRPSVVSVGAGGTPSIVAGAGGAPTVVAGAGGTSRILAGAGGTPTIIAGAGGTPGIRMPGAHSAASQVGPQPATSSVPVSSYTSPGMAAENLQLPSVPAAVLPSVPAAVLPTGTQRPYTASHVPQPSSLPYTSIGTGQQLPKGKPEVPNIPGLPKGWEKCVDSKTGRVFYKDHISKSTHWELPPDFYASREAIAKTKDSLKGATVDIAKLSQKTKMKRSLSSPNLADLDDNEEDSSSVPRINREQKPKDQGRLVDRSTKPLSAGRLQNLSPVYGSKGRFLTGLKNLGNTCYMNAVIQCLTNTIPLAKYLFDGYYLDDLNARSSNRRPGEITKELAFLVKVLWSGQYRSVSPVDFKLEVGRFAPQFAGTKQQDAHEFLMFYMDGLHEDVNRVRKSVQMKEQNNDNVPDAIAAEKAWGEYRRKNDSMIVDLFQGQFRSTVTCQTCGKKSVTFDAFNCLPLQLTSKGSCHLEDCIRSFTRSERIGGNDSWKCSRCKTYREATKTIEIWKLPPVLIIQLKRFSYDGMWHNKLQTTVHFPVGDFNMRKYAIGEQCQYNQFKLYGVVNHYGSFECGHYTSYCENAHYGKWFCYDDNVVKEIDRSSVKTSAAYLLFYTALDFSAYLSR